MFQIFLSSVVVVWLTIWLGGRLIWPLCWKTCVDLARCASILQSSRTILDAKLVSRFRFHAPMALAPVMLPLSFAIQFEQIPFAVQTISRAKCKVAPRCPSWLAAQH